MRDFDDRDLLRYPNPLAPTLRETIHHALDEHERDQFVAHLRDTFTSTQPTQLWAGAVVPVGVSQSTDTV